MTALASHQASDFLKLLFIGDSGAGKTGALVSLVQAGYKLRILDMDNNLLSLITYIKKDCPDKIGLVDAETRRDRFKMTAAGPITIGTPKAFVESVNLMNKWSDDTVPSEWGADTIFVLDSLTRFGDAAFEWAKGMAPTVKDPRQWYGTAQDAVEHALAILTSPEFKANVIVISHVDVREFSEGTVKGYPMSVGKALGPKIPSYFSTMILAETSGTGENVKRKLRTVPTGILDLKNPAPFRISKELPLESGLATLFEQLKGN